jgi:hypothetical protein
VIWFEKLRASSGAQIVPFRAVSPMAVHRDYGLLRPEPGHGRARAGYGGLRERGANMSD